MRHLLIEEAHPIITDFLADFCAFACEKLGLTTCPPITFVEHTGNASFGSYSPSEGTVIVATSGRHAADILRTLAHEFVHEQQIKSGSEQTLIEMEYEANAIAGLLMREYNQLHPGLYGVMDSVGVENDTDEHESFGATAADPTRPSGPINMAESHELTLWGLPKGQTDRLHEVVLSTQCKTQADLDKIKARAAKDGWHGFRVSHLDLSKKPDFVKAIKEDAPVNAAGSGEIAGIGVGPQGEPGIKKSKMIRRKPKSGLATIFAGFPRKTLKEYKAHITKKLNWNEIEKDTVSMSTPLVTPKKNLGFLGLPHKSLKQFLKGK